MKAEHVSKLPPRCKLKFADGKIYTFVRFIKDLDHVEYSNGTILTQTSLDWFLKKKPRATKKVMAEIRKKEGK